MRHIVRRTAKLIVRGLIAGAVFSGAVPVAADPFETQFEKITVGLTGEAVIGLIGRQPDSEKKTVFLTVPETRWRWDAAGGHSYIVLLVKNRVVMTRSCFAVANC
jgi:hypothetical protein